MWHKPCRTFHPWCPCIKTRCLSMLWLKLNHVSKRGPRKQPWRLDCQEVSRQILPHPSSSHLSGPWTHAAKYRHTGINQHLRWMDQGRYPGPIKVWKDNFEKNQVSMGTHLLLSKIQNTIPLWNVCKITKWMCRSDKYVPWHWLPSNGSWCIGIKGGMSGTVCVTFT